MFGTDRAVCIASVCQLSKQDDDAVKARLQVRRNRAAANEQNEAGANGRPRRGQ